MQESLEIVALREHYESTLRREAYKYQQQIEALTRELQEEKQRNALLEAELVQHLRAQPFTSSSPPLSLPFSSPALILNEEKNKIASVMFVEAREMKEKETGRKYTAYIINVQNAQGATWTIHKRYRQFEVLHFLLARRFGEAVPDFPPKHELIGMSEG
eukprot:Phypoly_transcript_15782.p1 GENE.Phypoly_transcript_15782~~Phypoly_transcript_15782.p1  ORF type:complete len:159 (+),score=36.02 Phypoly_transcript_15782:119-595(+)